MWGLCLSDAFAPIKAKRCHGMLYKGRVENSLTTETWWGEKTETPTVLGILGITKLRDVGHGSQHCTRVPYSGLVSTDLTTLSFNYKF